MDLWLTAVYNDPQVQGSEIGPVTYLRNGTGNPLVTYSELGTRWGVSKATVGRVLKKLSDAGYISLMTFPGRHGSVIYLQNYLSTMFQISDVMIDKEEVAMVLNIKLELPEDGQTENPEPAAEHHVCVSEGLSSVSESHIQIILGKMAKILTAQGISCFGCPKSKYKLFPLSDVCGEVYLLRARDSSTSRMGLTILCGDDMPVATFELTLSPLNRKIYDEATQ